MTTMKTKFISINQNSLRGFNIRNNKLQNFGISWKDVLYYNTKRTLNGYYIALEFTFAELNKMKSGELTSILKSTLVKDMHYNFLYQIKNKNTNVLYKELLHNRPICISEGAFDLFEEFVFYLQVEDLDNIDDNGNVIEPFNVEGNVIILNFSGCAYSPSIVSRLWVAPKNRS